jgi:hypothetical protein
LGQSRASREHDAVALSQAHDARRKAEVISEKAIGDIAKLGRAMSSAMAALGVPLGPRTPETLIEEVGRLPAVVRELELSTARRTVHRVIAMFESHYQAASAGPHGVERRLGPRCLRRLVRRVGGRFRYFRSRDGRRHPEGPGTAATR